MRKLKIFLMLLTGLCLCTVLYANLRKRSPSEGLKPIQLTAFNIGLQDQNQSTTELQNKISAMSGVTSCALSKEKDLMAVTFHPDEITEDALTKIITDSHVASVSIRDLSANASGGCPVQKLNASLSTLVRTLDFRN
jgi:hypothetical protein